MCNIGERMFICFSLLFVCYSGNFNVYFVYSRQVIYVIVKQLYVEYYFYHAFGVYLHYEVCGVFPHLTTSSLIERISISPWAVYILIPT
jgi:hypothetical protein